MMKALASSSSRVFPGKYRGKWFSSTMDAQIRFLRCQKLVDVGFFNSISVQHKPIHPISSSSPEPQAELETAETKIQKKSRSNTVHVRLQLQKRCSYGEQFLIVGDDPMFGLWDPSIAVPLCWSDGHVWTAELDIPIGKLIQFKFILKGITGTILWQPGPDRILRTWATENTITVVEDWEDAELQKITEGPVSILNEEPVINSDTLIAAEDVTRTKDAHISDINKESAITVTTAHPSEKPPAEAQNKLTVADNIPKSQEKLMAMVAENIIYPKEEPLANANEVLRTKTAPSPEATSEKDVLMAGNNLADNGRAAPIKNPGSAEIKENLITYEGPVLVPGLTPLSTIPTEEISQDGDKRSTSMDASVGAMEAKDQTVPESDDKQEPEGEPHHEGTTEMVFNDEKEELQDAELEQETSLAEENQMNSDSPGNGFLGNDVQWGRRTLQKFLTNLGFPIA